MDPKLIQRLDDYENLWFPIIQATLDAHYREISAQVFENVSQTSGRDVLVSMSVILGRLEALGRGDFGEDGKQRANCSPVAASPKRSPERLRRSWMA